MPGKPARTVRALLTALAVLSAAFVALTVSPGAARADWAHDQCSYAKPYETRTEPEEWLEPVGKVYRYGSPDHEVNDTIQVSESVTSETTQDYGLSLGFSEIFEIAASFNYTIQKSLSFSQTVSHPVKAPKGQFWEARLLTVWKFVRVYKGWKTDTRYCGSHLDSIVRWPHAYHICDYPAGSLPESYCRDWRYVTPSGGAGSGGSVNPPSSGPAPVTSVHGLAEGTVLATTDTRRIYKIVGGAPVWQSTCADGICLPESRPTTQAVIDAGPATPRNAATAVDQRGRVYVFVGGAPLWQESCDAPVSCGTPVKVSNWSIDARDHMNRVPADGNLVQAKAGTVDLPVAMTVGGALIPFASPQEVIDVGQGGDWGQRVVAISAGSYNLLGFSPADGTLVQGTGGGVSGPVAMAVGGAFIPFANVQELIDVGQGDNWASRVRAIPLRAFNAHPRVPSDSVLIQGTGGGASTPVATLVGGARVNFASPQEIIDSGYGADWPSKVRAIPLRAFSEIRDDLPIDGTLVQAQGTPVAAVIGSARVNFASPQEVVDSGYSADWQPLVRIIPARVFNAMPTKIADGTRLRKAGSSSQSGIIGGARVDFHSMAELEAAGYGPRPTQTVPARVWDALTTRIGDGTRIKDADSTGQAAIVGGARISFVSGQELIDSGYGNVPMQVVPNRVWTALPAQIADGTRIAKAGATSEAAIVGRARIDFHTMAELQAAGYGGKLRQVIPARVWDGLTTRIADGTYVKSPDSAQVWLVSGGSRTPASQSSGVQVIPARVLEAIPPA